jgi:hypothetical protein
MQKALMDGKVVNERKGSVKPDLISRAFYFALDG